MSRAAAPAVKHLTEAEFAAREGFSVQTARILRRNGDGPRYLQITESATNGTIRYRLADVEEWELSLLVDPRAKALAAT